MSIHDLLKMHKKTMFSLNTTAVECVLKPYPSHTGFKVNGLTNFTGLTIEESGYGVWADTFELTVNFDDLSGQTTLIPTRNWVLTVKVPQLDYKVVPFYIEDVAVDRTLGMYLIKCTLTTVAGDGKRITRSNGGL